MKLWFALLGLSSLLILSGCSAANPQATPEFAQCLTDKGVVMYGAFWCGHCQKVKNSFGDNFDYITYVECDPKGKNPESQRCLDENIEGYPTFVFADGSRLTGEQSFQVLAEKTGCSLPVVEE